MKNKLLVALSFLGLGTPAFAQSADSVETKNHLGIIAKPRLEKIFTANQSLPVGLIYKRQVKSDQAVRASLVGSYSSFKSDMNSNYPVNNYPITQNSENINTSFQVMAGYEWQNQLSKKWNFYYGTDFGFAQLKNESNPKMMNNQSDFPVALIIYYWHSKTNSLLLQPFAGFQFKVSSNLYFAVETAITASKSETEQVLFKHYSATENAESKSEELHTDTSENFNIWYKPISNIQLVYKF